MLSAFGFVLLDDTEAQTGGRFSPLWHVSCCFCANYLSPFSHCKIPHRCVLAVPGSTTGASEPVVNCGGGRS